MARPFTVIGFTMFFTLALVFELGQKAGSRYPFGSSCRLYLFSVLQERSA